MKILSYDEGLDLITLEASEEQVDVMRLLTRIIHEVDPIIADICDDGDIREIEDAVSKIGSANNDGVVLFQIHNELLAAFPSIATAALQDSIVKGEDRDRARTLREGIRNLYSEIDRVLRG